MEVDADACALQRLAVPSDLAAACMARCLSGGNPDAVRAFVESCRFRTTRSASSPRSFADGRMGRSRYERMMAGTDSGSQALGASAHGGADRKAPRRRLGPVDRRRHGALRSLAAQSDRGECCWGSSWKAPTGVANANRSLRCPAGICRDRPRGLSLSLGYRTIPSEPYPPEMQMDARPHAWRLARQKRRRLPASCDAGTRDRPDRRGACGVIAGHSEAPQFKGGHIKSGRCRYKTSPSPQGQEVLLSDATPVASLDGMTVKAIYPRHVFTDMCASLRQLPRWAGAGAFKQKEHHRGSGTVVLCTSLRGRASCWAEVILSLTKRGLKALACPNP